MDDIFPIIICPPIYTGDKSIRFLSMKDQIDIETDQVDLFWRVLEKCNGTLSYEDICDSFNEKKSIVSYVLEYLFNLHIICDSRKQYNHFHELSSYPTNYMRNLTQKEIEDYRQVSEGVSHEGENYYYKIIDSEIERITCQRRTCRVFDLKKISLDILGSICDVAYNTKKHRVPSGGALYPVRVFAIVVKDQLDFPKGYYEYNEDTRSLVQYSSNVDIEQLKYCFNSESVGFGSPVQLILAADLDRQTYKYSNRGYRLTMIEIGQVAQNISLYCEELGLGSCELGGLLDDSMKVELELKGEIYPILGIAIGYKSDNKIPTDSEMLFIEDNISRWNLKSGSYGLVNYIKSNSFFAAIAKYGPKEGQVAGATSASSEHAIFKAVVEAFERKVSGNARVDYIGSLYDLRCAGNESLNPRDFIPLSQEQCKKCGVKYFDEKLPIQWTIGRKYSDSGRLVYIPTDMVYYGHKYGENPIYIGNSNGIAAFEDFDGAFQRAVTEIIERDAIMRCWFSQKAPCIVDQEIMPIHIKKRIHDLQQDGYQVKFLELESQYAEVILAIIIGDKYPYFTCGSSATFIITEERIEEVCIKALQEAEFCLYSALKYPKALQTAIDVYSPDDHASYYHITGNVEKIRWLWSGIKTKEYTHKQSFTLPELDKLLDFSYVEIADKETYNLSVVRVFSPRLIPINFGLNTAHYLHKEVDYILNNRSLEEPHFFA